MFMRLRVCVSFGLPILPSVLPKERREAGRDDAGSVGVSVGHERRG